MFRDFFVCLTHPRIPLLVFTQGFQKNVFRIFPLKYIGIFRDGFTDVSVNLYVRIYVREKMSKTFVLNVIILYKLYKREEI